MSATRNAVGSSLLPAPIEDITGTPATFARFIISSLPVTVSMASIKMCIRDRVGMTSNHHAPYDLGLTRTTMAVNRGMQSREVERTPKSLSLIHISDIPDNALAIERGRETIKEGYAEKKLKARTEKFEAIHGKSEEKLSLIHISKALYA